MPYFEPSRPMPLSFMPPNGTISVYTMASLMPTMPYSSPSATRPLRSVSQTVKAGGGATGLFPEPKRRQREEPYCKADCKACIPPQMLWCGLHSRQNSPSEARRVV